MSANTPSDTPPKGGDEKDLSRKLKKRLLIAGGLVALALAAIPLLDHFGKGDKVAMTATEPQGSSGKIANVASAPEEEAPAAVESSAPAAAEASQPAQRPAEPHAPATVSQAAPPAPDTGKTPGVAAIRGKAPSTPTAPKLPPVVQAEKESTSTRPQAFKPLPQDEAAPAPPPPISKAKPVGSSLGYKVQLGLFSSLANAQKLVDTLKANGIEAHTETRVHVGPFRTRAEAEEAMNKLRQLGHAPLLAPSGQ
ncbi:MAG: SPOR domain-containing protein [Pseudogulbenkiania sp.]|nr:SPOR domain-containing protein [Pseudogulbenkiania sp.]